MARLDTSLESAGAEFLVLGNLLIEGIQAFKTYTNFPGYDLIATYPEKKRACRIQVTYLKQLQQHEHVQLNDVEMDAILETHCITPTLLRANDFEGFITTRKRTLLTKIEAVMGKAIVLSDEAVPEDEPDEED